MLSASRSLPAVSASASRMRARMPSGKRSRSPMKRTRTPRRCSSDTSRSSALRNSFISAPTSSSGRPQFSLENANRVRAPMPLSRQKSMHRLTARAPARWPMARGRWRCWAQRPLPSMITARWRGTRDAAGGGVGGAVMQAAGSDRHQLLFLRLDHLVHVLDRLVGHLLDLGLAARGLVLRHLLLLQQFLDLLVGVAADVADRDLGVLALGVHDLAQLAAALLGQRGQVEADHDAGGVRGEPEVGAEDRLLLRADDLLLVRGDGQRARVGHGHAG